VCGPAVPASASALSLEEQEELAVFLEQQALLSADVEALLTASSGVQCLKEAKLFCVKIQAQCRSECYEIEDETRRINSKKHGVNVGSLPSSESGALLETETHDRARHGYVHPVMHDGAENSDHKSPICAADKCNKLHSHCRRVHEDACGLSGEGKEPAVKWASLRAVTAQANRRRGTCIKNLRAHCKKLRQRCDSDCKEDRSDAAEFLTPSCLPNQCRSKYNECKESSTEKLEELCNPELFVAKHVVGVGCSIADDNCVKPLVDPNRCISGCSPTQIITSISHA